MSWNNKSSKAWKSAWKKGNTTSSIASIGTGVIGAINSFASNNTIDDTSGIESSLDSINNRTFSTGFFDSLQSNFNLNALPSNFTMEDIDSTTGGQKVGNVLSGITSGASAGATIGGPWGALIGGVIGAGSGIAGWITGNQKAKEEAAKLNKKAEEATNNMLNNYSLSALNTHNTNFKNSLLSMAAYGGNLDKTGDFTNNLIFINNGGTHEENPLGGIPFGVDAEGTPNLVEEGEVIWNDYVFSNRLQPTEEFKRKYKVKGMTFADVAKELQKESEERPNDPISKNGLEDSMTKLIMEQEDIRQKNNKRVSNKFENGSWLRYAPVVGSALGVFSDLIGTTNKPDYSNIDRIQEATDRMTPIGYTPIGTYLSYNPLDKNFYSNKLAAQAGATRRAIVNQSINPGATMAGLLAADYNARTKMGDLFRQAEEYNQAQRERVAGFNRQTDAMNSEMAMKAAMVNQKIDELRLKSAMTQAQMRDQIEAQANVGRSANLSNLFTNLGNIGTDILNRADRDMLIKTGVFGTLSQKPSGWTDAEWDDYLKSINDKKIVPTPTTAPVVAPSSPKTPVYGIVPTPVYTIGQQKAMPYSEEIFGCGGRVRKGKNKKGLTY